MLISGCENTNAEFPICTIEFGEKEVIYGPDEPCIHDHTHSIGAKKTHYYTLYKNGDEYQQDLKDCCGKVGTKYGLLTYWDKMEK